MRTVRFDKLQLKQFGRLAVGQAPRRGERAPKRARINPCLSAKRERPAMRAFLI